MRDNPRVESPLGPAHYSRSNRLYAAATGTLERRNHPVRNHQCNALSS